MPAKLEPRDNTPEKDGSNSSLQTPLTQDWSLVDDEYDPDAGDTPLKTKSKLHMEKLENDPYLQRLRLLRRGYKNALIDESKYSVHTINEKVNRAYPLPKIKVPRVGVFNGAMYKFENGQLFDSNVVQPAVWQKTLFGELDIEWCRFVMDLYNNPTEEVSVSED